jgi:hypothetical protein
MKLQNICFVLLLLCQVRRKIRFLFRNKIIIWQWTSHGRNSFVRASMLFQALFSKKLALFDSQAEIGHHNYLLFTAPFVSFRWSATFVSLPPKMKSLLSTPQSHFRSSKNRIWRIFVNRSITQWPQWQLENLDSNSEC